jgi:hypothetical protein
MHSSALKTDSRIIQNVYTSLPNYTASTKSPPRKPQITQIKALAPLQYAMYYHALILEVKRQ